MSVYCICSKHGILFMNYTKQGCLALYYNTTDAISQGVTNVEPIQNQKCLMESRMSSIDKTVSRSCVSRSCVSRSS